jgi:polyhydroxyalkanoate synthesis regulator phasin
MSEPTDLTLRTLIELREAMKAGFDRMDARFTTLETRLESVKKAAFGESLVGRYMAAEVEERIEALEQRLSALEGKH